MSPFLYKTNCLLVEVNFQIYDLLSQCSVHKKTYLQILKFKKSKRFIH